MKNYTKKYFTALIMLSYFFAVCVNVNSQSYKDVYKQPEIIKGENLILGTNSYFDNINVINSYYNGISYKFGLDGSYNRWYLSPKLNYAVHTNLKLSTNRVQPVPGIDNASHRSTDKDYANSVNKFTNFQPGLAFDINYYPFRFPVYAGFHIDSYAAFADHDHPYSSSYIYPYLGIGRLTNMSLISEAIAFEDILKKNGVIKSQLNGKQRELLVKLLERRNNSEYLSKYKDDSEIRFMKDVEMLLRKNGLLKGNLGARATMSLYQAFTNSAFIFYPKFNGWQIQTEIKRKLFAVPDDAYMNFYSILFSGLYGKLLSDNSTVLSTIFFETSLNTEFNLSGYDYFFHSPQLISGQNQITDFETVLLPPQIDYNWLSTASLSGKIQLFHNFSPVIGLNSLVDYSFVKVDYKSIILRNFTFAETGAFNIISKLIFSLTASFNYNEDLLYGDDHISLKRAWRFDCGFKYYIF